RARGFVMLVEDLADQFLQKILQGHDPERPAKLVNDDGEVTPLPLHVEEEVAAAPGGGSNSHRTHRQRIGLMQLEEIERMQHPDDLVEGLPVHRNPAVSAFPEDAADVA